MQDTSPSRILVVDDEASCRETLEALLSGYGYDLAFATSGTACLASARERLPDLILLDVMMPDMDGFETCARLRREPETAEVPVIMVTALDDRQSKLQGLGAGADDFVAKPFDATELRARIRTIVRLNRFRRIHTEHARFQLLFENSPDGIALLDHDGRICLANPSLVKLVGREVIDTDFSLLLTEEHRGPWRQALAAVCGARGEMAPTEMAVRSETGTVLPIEVSVVRQTAMVDVGAQVIVRDITWRKRLEAQLFQAQKLELLGHMAGGIAHDFRNVLTVVGMHAELVINGLSSGDALRQDAEVISRMADRATGLCHRLLAFSRRQELKLRPMELNETIRAGMEILGPTLGRRIRVSLDLKDDPLVVEADPTQLQQVFLNLAVNARDVMPVSGEFSIATERVQSWAASPVAPGLAPGSYALTTVSDTGCGMDEETRKRIFEPFFTTKPEGKGTGLGMSVVYGIVTQMGGHIDVESAPGEGATFRVFLPLHC